MLGPSDRLGRSSTIRGGLPCPLHELGENGDIVVASTIENPNFGSATLFVQRLPAAVGMKIPRDERRRILESELLKDDLKLRQRLSGLLGAHKNRTANKTQAESETDFWKRNLQTLRNTPLDSQKGHDNVQLRISESF